jgi:Tol biopolymer transport system component
VFYTVFDPKTSLHALMLRELATGRETELGRYYMRFPELSPDGKWIAFLGYSKTAKTYPLTVIPVTGGAGREVCSFPPTGPRGVAWTPDGRQLIVGIQSGRKTELWRVPAAGGTPEKIDINVDGMWQFRLHPDGRRIAFETWENNEEVWAIENLLPRPEPKPTGMAVRRVLTADSAAEGAIDAGATIISFTDWVTGDLAVRELPSGNKRRLTNKGSFAQSREYAEFSVPSRDGQQVLYSWMRADGIYELRIMGIDGSGPRTIYEGTGLGEVPEPFDWSPDGRHVLAALNPQDRPGTQLAVLPVAGGSTRAVVTVPAGFWPFQRARFSPDGRFIAFDQQARGGAVRADIFVVASDGSRRWPLVQHAASDLLIDWSPDGRYILFSSDRAGTNDAWLVAVKDGTPLGEPRLIKKDLGRIAPMGIARDGSFYYGVDTGGREAYLAEVDPASGKVLAAPRLVAERYFGGNVSPEWSPDGRRLIYVSRRGPIGPAFNIPTIRSMETGETRELVTGLAFVNQVRWSLDGRSLLCVCIDKAEKSGICRIDAQTGAFTLLGDGVFPSGALDDRHILFITGVQDEQAGTAQPVIRMRDLGTGEEREVVRVGHYRYGVSQDGRQLAFQVVDSATKDTVVKVMPLTGGESREVFRSKKLGMFLSWTADGRSILVGGSDEANEALWLVPVGGGKALRFTAGMKGIEGPRLHPDGRQLAFYTTSEGKGEVWVLENFLPAGKGTK